MSKVNKPKKQSNHAEPAVSKKHTPAPPPTRNHEYYETKLKEKEQKLRDQEREAFSAWLGEHEAAKAKLYMQCADNMERLCQRKSQHFFGQLGGKIVLPLNGLQQLINKSTQLSEPQRDMFRGAIQAYFSYRGVSMQPSQPAAPAPATAPVKTEVSTVSSRLKNRPQQGRRRTQVSVTDTKAVTHEELVKRANGFLNHEESTAVDYDQVGPLLTRLNGEFGEQELLGSIELSDQDYKMLRGYFKTVYKMAYEAHQRAAQTDADESDILLDKPTMIALVAIAKRVEALDYWEELAKLVFGADSERFDGSWLEGLIVRSFACRHKEVAATNKQKALQTILMHANVGADD